MDNAIGHLIAHLEAHGATEPWCAAAAAEIERLTAENERLRAALFEAVLEVESVNRMPMSRGVYDADIRRWRAVVQQTTPQSWLEAKKEVDSGWPAADDGLEPGDECRELEAARWALGLKILETAQSCAEGYRRNVSQFNTASENSESEKCAIAASNTGWFILQSLGFSKDYIQRLKVAAGI